MVAEASRSFSENKIRQIRKEEIGFLNDILDAIA